MKVFTKIKLITIFVLLMGCFTSQATGYSYRVQYVASYDSGYIKVLNNIDNKTKYMLPNGQELYFTGGFFASYTDAEKQLQSLQNAGFNTATIRLFHNGKMVSSYDLK